MASFVIEGGHKLCGDIHPQGVADYLCNVAYGRKSDGK